MPGDDAGSVTAPGSRGAGPGRRLPVLVTGLQEPKNPNYSASELAQAHFRSPLLLPLFRPVSNKIPQSQSFISASGLMPFLVFCF